MQLESDDHSAIEQNIYIKSLNAANSDLTAVNVIDMIENVKTKKQSQPEILVSEISNESLDNPAYINSQFGHNDQTEIAGSQKKFNKVQSVTSDNFKPKDLLENEKIQRQNS